MLRIFVLLVAMLSVAAFGQTKPAELTIADIVAIQEAGTGELLDSTSCDYVFTGLKSVKVKSSDTYQVTGTAYFSTDARRITADVEHEDTTSVDRTSRIGRESYLMTRTSYIRNVGPNNTLEEFKLDQAGVLTGPAQSMRKSIMARNPAFIETWLCGTSSISLADLVKSPVYIMKLSVQDTMIKVDIRSKNRPDETWVVLTLDPTLHCWVKRVDAKVHFCTVDYDKDGRPVHFGQYRNDTGERVREFTLSNWKTGVPSKEFDVAAIMGDSQLMYTHPLTETDSPVIWRKTSEGVVVDEEMTADAVTDFVMKKKGGQAKVESVSAAPAVTAVPSSGSSTAHGMLFIAAAVVAAIVMFVLLWRLRL